MLRGASFFSQASAGPRMMWRWASMKPAITVMPAASMVVAPAGTSRGAPGPTETILPSLATTEPRSITRPAPSMMWALAITTLWAAAAPARPSPPTIAAPISAASFFIGFPPRPRRLCAAVCTWDASLGVAERRCKHRREAQ